MVNRRIHAMTVDDKDAVAAGSGLNEMPAVAW
jgi:hypothetical protein